MAKKKTAKKATTTKATKAKRPPRVVWALVESDGSTYESFRTRRAADEYLNDPVTSCLDTGVRVVGPYILAERVREK